MIGRTHDYNKANVDSRDLHINNENIKVFLQVCLKMKK